MKKYLLIILSVFFTVFASAQALVSILPPSDLAGNYPFVRTSNDDGAWAILPDIDDPVNLVIGFLAVGYDDGTWEDPDGVIAADSLGCSPLVNGDELVGKVAVIYRGLCSFSLKTYNAQAAGAIGVMIVNVDGGAISGMTGLDSSTVDTIPLWLLENDVVDDWRPEIDAGEMEIFFGNKNGLFPNDIGLTSKIVLRAEHFSHPRALAQDATEYSVQLGAGIINFGSEDQSDVTLSAEISLDGDVIYSEASETPVSMASGDTTFFTLPDFSQDTYESGLYELTYTSNIPDEDGFPSDNTLEADFMISDSIFSYSGVESDGEPRAVQYWSQDGMSSDTEASNCIAFTDPHASRMIVEGLTFSFSKFSGYS
jgi:hypothetical protein